MWIYQLNQRNWSPAIFRYEIWENRRSDWYSGKKKGNTLPEPGDTLVFFYSPSTESVNRTDPGIYGWAVIDRWLPEKKRIFFVPTAPTNHLKMDPWWDKDAQKIANVVRGPDKQATLFPADFKAERKIRNGIRKWLG